MELQFRKSTLRCLWPAVREVQNMEATQELKLTEGMPDVGRILAAWGQVILRGKEWRSDSILCSGGIQAWVLYAPEDGSGEQILEGWIPFQMVWQLPADTSEGTIRVECRPRFLDARSVSARKIMLRAGIAALGEAYSPREAEVAQPPEEAEGIQLLKALYPLWLTREAGEKTFLLDEELPAPENLPRADRLIYYTLHPRITDKKVLSGKLVFRGTGNLHVLCRDDQGQLFSWESEVPFSQFAELDREYGSDAWADFLPAVTNLELEPEENGNLRLKCGLVAQYRIADRQLLELVEDAYCPGRALQIQWGEVALPVELESRQENLYGEQKLPAEVGTPVDVTFLTDYPRQRRMGESVEMEIPGWIQMLYYGPDGTLTGTSARWEGKETLKANPQTELLAVPLPPQNVTTMPAQEGVTVKMELPMELTAAANQRLSMVTALDLGQEQVPDPTRPSVILRRAGDGRLWDIAKESGSTMEAIRAANHLETDPAPNQMLLIPVL